MTRKEVPGIVQSEFSGYPQIDPVVEREVYTGNAELFIRGIKTDLETIREAHKPLKVVLDLQSIESIGATGLRLLRALQIDLKREKGEIVLANSSKKVSAVLELSGFSLLFKQISLAPRQQS